VVGTDLIIVGSSALSIVLGVAYYFALRGRRQMRDLARLKKSVADKSNTPPSLHPVIDPNICIGSLSCVKACPEGDILGLVEGKATLVEGSHCIGHSKCATECPVDAIKLVFGSKTKGVDLPETDDRFESSRPGVYIVGELGGMGLIKNALRQGIEVSKVLKREVKGAGGDSVDVAIVGAGPSGIATAVGCRDAGLSFRLLEQDTLGGTVAHYPRGKVVMSETVNLPLYGKFGRSLLSKEELLEEFNKVLGAANVDVEEGVKVEGIDGGPGKFRVRTSKGEVAARSIVLATGLRGSPRKLGVPGEEGSKVVYRMVDATQYEGQRVLVVGGGDSAVEAAIQLANETSAKVTISYRKDSFSRAKPRNREFIADLVQKKKVRALMSSQVQEVRGDRVVVKTEDGQLGQLQNDSIIVCIGGEVPTKFLQSVGVSVRRYQEEEKGGEGARKQARKVNRRLGAALTLLGLGIIAALTFVGWQYYLVPQDLRAEHPLHEHMRPAGIWGHGVGVIATLFMMSNFIYVLRKRLKVLKGSAPIRTWLTMHMFVGIMSPLVIAFHAAFQFKNGLAVATWGSLAIVVGTGVFGRFLFGLMPAAAGKVERLEELQERMKSYKERLGMMMESTTNIMHVQTAYEFSVMPPPEMSALAVLRYAPKRRRQITKAARAVKKYFPDLNDYSTFENSLREIGRLRWQIALYAQLKKLFRVWLGLHVTLACSMVLLIAVHVAISLYLGYAWIFTEAQ
jgi:putative YpdA family bacillithiol system oxidoreductase